MTDFQVCVMEGAKMGMIVAIWFCLIHIAGYAEDIRDAVVSNTTVVQEDA